MRSAEERCATWSGGDPRVAELHTVVARLRRELAALPAELSDRAIAEDELAGLAAMLRGGTPEVPRLRRSLLLIAGAIGSVSALAPAVGRVRAAVDRFDDDRRDGDPPGDGRFPEGARDGPPTPPDLG
ncbi:DUF5955 family protein [Streptomyces sp. CA-294286]|uniref:DUF5955 family protein n=1 Tax=Streptomyces sp. CA-294286 TaxID=3240070 RepID=UPI003D8C74E8